MMREGEDKIKKKKTILSTIKTLTRVKAHSKGDKEVTGMVKMRQGNKCT